MDVSVICTSRAYFSSDFDGIFSEFPRKGPFRTMHISLLFNWSRFWHRRCSKHGSFKF